MARAPATPLIRFRTLGATDLRLPTGEEVSGVLAQPKRLALLAYLAIEKPDGFHRRDTLLALFWPELDLAHARDALNQAIRHLRLELGADAIVSRGTTELGLDGNRLWCDAVAFRQAIAASDPEQALKLYRGPLLDGLFTSAAAPEFEQWLESERSDVRRRAATCALILAERGAASGEIGKASELARRAAALLPESEHELRRVLAVLDSAGERATALALFERFSQRVAEDFGAEPTPETRQFVDQMRARRDPRPNVPNESGVANQREARVPPSAIKTAAAYPRRFTWRRSLRVGALGFAGLVAAGGFVAMRASCPGPARALLACSAVHMPQGFVIADFVDRSGDSTLSITVTEALRVDLAESRAIQLMQPNAVRQALGLMQRNANEKVSTDVAREIAVREGLGAVLVGEIDAAGSGFVLLARIIAAESGDQLLAVRAVAADSSKVIGAIESLSRKLRAGIGEARLSIRASPPLERATTASLPALQQFTAGSRAFSRGDYEAAIRHLREATAIDTTFAEAYRTLGAQLNSVPGSRKEQIDALTRAFRFRERLTPRMRHFVAGSYYSTVGGDLRTAVREYQAAVDADPTFRQAIANQGGLYSMLREFEDYRSNVDWMLRVDRPVRGYYYHLIMSLVHLGRLDSAQRALAQFDSLVLADPGYTRARDEAASLGAWLAFQRRDYAEVRRRAVVLQASNAGLAVNGEAYRAYADAIEGRVANAEQAWHVAIEHARSHALGNLALRLAAGLSGYEGMLHGERTAFQSLHVMQHDIPLDSIPGVERPYEELVIAHARSGDAIGARKLLSAMERESPDSLLTYDQRFLRLRARGVLAIEEDRLNEAISLLRAADSGSCVVCALPDLGRAYDRSQNADSALAVYERYIGAFDDDRWRVDPIALAPTLRRLGELFEERHDSVKARRYYDDFVTLWKNADAELQPLVRDVQQRLTLMASGAVHPRADAVRLPLSRGRD